MTIPAISFVDRSSVDDAMVLVRVVDESVGLCLTRRKNGDIKLLFGLEELDGIIEALQTARTRVSG